MQVRTSGVSCPEVHQGDGVVVFIIRCANGQRRADTVPKTNDWREGRTKGRKDEWREREAL